MTLVTLENRGGKTFEVNSKRPILETLRDQGVDLPFGCKYGGCITCAEKLSSGKDDQKRKGALNKRQINEGYIILCVARQINEITIKIGVESHDRLTRNPFIDNKENK